VVDGSKPGERAVDLAGDIAAKCDAALTLAHVQVHPSTDSSWQVG
jgi:nucleotide-binding universal stress UspA family protein